jgi:phospho-N-acetylmuramoyl-pentapeptide-transferase
MTYALLWGCVAALAALALGYPFVAFLRSKKLGKAISDEGPATHHVKQGTPTFGGVLIMGVAIIFGLALAVPEDSDVWLPLAVAAAALLLGLWDDAGTLVDRAQREAHGRGGMAMKVAILTALGALATYVLYVEQDAPRLIAPHYGHYDIGPLYWLFAVGAVVALGTAADLADGLDMLAGGLSAAAYAAFGAIALMQGQDGVATLCFVTVGALAGFLWFNAHPARVFMGDTGSLPLGAMLAVVALQTGWWLLIPLICIVFVAEVASSVIQIAYFRATSGKRIFRMAPIHHHFEKLGMPETRIAARFILIGVLAALAGVALTGL